MKIKHLLKKEEGSGLVLTLMVLSVLSILSLSIGALTVGTYRLSGANRDATSAYYIAEAGATAAYDEIQNEVLRAYDNNQTRDSFYNQVSAILASKNGDSTVNFDSQFGSEPTAKIQINEETPQKYTIYSTGSIDGKERTVKKQLTTTWVEKTTGGGGLPEIPAETTLFVDEKIELLGGTLKGKGYIQSIDNNAVQIGTYGSFKESTLHYSNQTTSDKLMNYPNYMKDSLPGLSTEMKNVNFTDYKPLINQIVAPDITKKISIQKIGKKHNLKLESDVYIPRIEMSADEILSVNTGDSDYTILVDSLKMNGDTRLQIQGGGTLTIVIKNSFSVDSGSVYFNENQNSNKLILVYLGDAALNLGNNLKINGHMIVKKADVAINSVPINGVFLTGGKKVEFTGGFPGSKMMLIAPNAVVSLAGSYSINGAVVAKKFIMSGGAELSYTKIDTTGFPFGSSRPVIDPNPEDIINSGVIIED
ncbi:MAG: hypothetical protein KC455_03535 [Carnobacterium sp.]|nr:hypothetical protein [Carnobacterium sp.]